MDETVTYEYYELHGLFWMDRNLGASEVPASSTDANGYGDLFQWGRLADGHQARSSDLISTQSTEVVPGHSDFIYDAGFQPAFNDWLTPQNDDLWQGADGINNPCPEGWRVPTKVELETEVNSWEPTDGIGAFASALKWPLGGFRGQFTGNVYSEGGLGYIWSSTIVEESDAINYLAFFETGIMWPTLARMWGASVRCVRDIPPVYNDTQGTYHNTIQEAIDEAVAEDVIEVAAGTYHEALTIGKALTINGPNAGISAGVNEGTRGPEAIIVAPSASVAVFVNQANIGTVTIDGFKVADNGAWTHGGIVQGSAAREGTTVHFLNNIVEAPPTVTEKGYPIQVTGDNSTVIGNRVEATTLTDPDWSAAGILVNDASDVLVQDNLVIGHADSDMGIMVQNYTSIPLNVTINGNRVENTWSGIYIMAWQGNVGPIDITDNTIYGNEHGLRFTNYGNASNSVTLGDVENNTFENNLYQVSHHADLTGIDLDDILVHNTFDRAVVIRAGEELIHKGKQTRGGDIKVPVIYSSIQDAIDYEFIAADDVIQVASGTYEEVLEIVEKNDITIIGAGKESTIVRANNSDLVNWPSYHQHNSRKTAILIDRSTDINIEGFTFDFDNVGTGGGHTGLMMWNSTGSFEDNAFINRGIVGHQTDVNAYVGADETTDYGHNNRAEVLFKGNEFVNTGRIGINVQDYVFVTIEDNNFTKEFDDPGYGVEMASLSNGLIKGNSFSNFNTFFTDDSASSGIYVHNMFTQAITTPHVKQVDLENNSIDNCTYGIYLGSSSGGTHWNLLGNVSIESNVRDNTITNSELAGIFVIDDGASIGSSVTVDFENNEIDGGDYGYHLSTYWGDGILNVSIINDKIINVVTGIRVIDYNDLFNDPTDSEYDVLVFESSMTAYSDFAIMNLYDDITIEATHNYWAGCPSFSGAVEVYPYYTEVDIVNGELVFNGLVENITATATPAQTCVGQQVTLQASGGSNYQWDQGLGSGSLKVVSHNEAGTYTYNVTGSDSRNCPIAYATVTVTVTEAPTVLINGVEDGSATIAVGSDITLTASGAETYEWVNMNETDAVITVSPQASTTYSVIGTTDGCIGKTNFTVNVASVNAGPNQWSCQGADVTLTAVASGLDDPTFNWTWDDGSDTGDQITVNPNSTTVYTVEATDGEITVTDNVTVYVYPKPVANAGSNITIPIGGSGVLNGSASGGTAPYSYFWTGPDGFDSDEKNPEVFVAGIYTLVVTDAFLCESDEATVVVTVVDSGVTVSGDIEYAFGVVNKEMHNVTVKLFAENGGEPDFEGEPDYTGITAATGPGVFEIVGVEPGTYYVKFDLDTDWGGVTSADIVAINNHIRGRVPLTGIKRIAADVVIAPDDYPDANVTIADRNLVNQRRVGQVSEFPETGDWVFTLLANIEDNPPDNDPFIFANDHFSNLTIEVEETDVPVQFRALCYGDVNASYTGPKELDFDFKDYGLPVFDVTEENWFELLNYPNPFTGETTIRYYQPIAGNVSIMVFNMMGEMIKKIEEPATEEGTYDIPVNMHGHNPGLYIYIVKLMTNDDIMIQHGKMILSR